MSAVAWPMFCVEWWKGDQKMDRQTTCANERCTEAYIQQNGFVIELLLETSKSVTVLLEWLTAYS